MAEAVGLINSGAEGGGGDGLEAGHGAEALDARIVRAEVRDHLIGIGEVAVEGLQGGEQRGGQRELRGSSSGPKPP
jgi:hypothetical protein